ncbi:peroxiredoxin [Propionivibrio dicarboxylicus]|uniref:thioredoxin-dependent peroxiredoxin n=1 Tax=Propionivibrio dicarboxylicus TaxID=83767 RepID=A0A1G8GCA9_9RHOO|nr:peroxiredoxin [Propionivibrio dicarboxylicus]SDH91993.1 peroxiredoxin Q/BCP [Propionivibrio dicarboxylicus]
MFKRLWVSLLLLCSTSAAIAEPIPEPGSIAPAFALFDQNGREITLEGLRGQWVVLYFYPKNDTPGCTEEACNFRDDIAQLMAQGATVLGVSIAETASNAQFAAKYHLPFSLLADRDGAVAKRYGAYADWMVVGFAKRYTFLIDPQGKIAKTYLKVDTSKHSAEIIADLKTLNPVRKP